MREALADAPAPVVAVSPFVAGEVAQGPDRASSWPRSAGRRPPPASLRSTRGCSTGCSATRPTRTRRPRDRDHAPPAHADGGSGRAGAGWPNGRSSWRTSPSRCGLAIMSEPDEDHRDHPREAPRLGPHPARAAPWTRPSARAWPRRCSSTRSTKIRRAEDDRRRARRHRRRRRLPATPAGWAIGSSRQESDGGHSQAAEAGARAAMGSGADRVAMLPVDCPLLDPAELDGHLGRSPRTALIVPDAAGHRDQRAGALPARRLLARLRARQLRPPRLAGPRGRRSASRSSGIHSLALDLDTPDDLAALRDALLLDPIPRPADRQGPVGARGAHRARSGLSCPARSTRPGRARCGCARSRACPRSARATTSER